MEVSFSKKFELEDTSPEDVLLVVTVEFSAYIDREGEVTDDGCNLQDDADDGTILNKAQKNELSDLVLAYTGSDEFSLDAGYAR